MAKFRFGETLSGHKQYLTKYMVQKDKENVKDKPVLFGNVTKEEYLKRIHVIKKPEYKNGKQIWKKESRYFKWILSPEKTLDDDVLQEFTKAFVIRLGQISGYDLMYQAAIHRDTAHPHVHIVINGVDMNGKILKKRPFTKDVIKNYAREICQEVLTKFCGERDYELKQAARENRITAERWTEFDQTIKEHLHQSNEEKYCGYIIKPLDGELKARLDFLDKLGLADYKDNKYFLKSNFEERLRIYGRYNIFRDAERYVPSGADLKMYKAEMGEITGKILHVYSMNDEDVWNNGVVMQNEKDGNYFFVPSYNPVNKKDGDRITVMQEKSDGGRKKDKTVFEYADKEAHKKEYTQEDIDNAIFGMEM